MKTKRLPMFCKKALVPLLLIFTPSLLFAQTDNPGSYMTAISNALENMNRTYMSYISAAAHSRRAKKIEKLRQQTIESIINSKYKISELPIYKGDNSLRKSAIDYVQLCYKVFNDDYAHIVNMEEIAEQSYDAMEAYILLQEKTNEKVQQASDSMHFAIQRFATKYNVQLIETTNELSEKMGAADKLNHYRNQVFLCFFKCNWQEAQIIEAINKKNLNNIEQSRNALSNFATAGLSALDSLKSFEGDASLSAACKQSLTFYKNEAEKDFPKMLDFYLKQDNFEKTKKSFESKATRTKDDVDTYNKSVNEMNSAASAFNKVTADMNANRTQATQGWEQTERSFVDTHMPHYKS
ncbi:LIC11966 family surface protein [Deminuibacter soli]|uniref:DUF3829 domain-containing protein n=1 Tax=Deminuibacter soli TaxID=2291815 RepID=A0A3E1NR31_9BACT|nr:hypothetical protein [Deminuibacter soli]RFM30238.1 hypothetical protein DXN05_04510 [Deminuibacter soli]